MRQKHLKREDLKVPADIAKMGLSELYLEYIEHCKNREKTHEIIYVKNPPHCKCKAYAVDIWNKQEDLFSISAETMFGKRETFAKEELYNYCK